MAFDIEDEHSFMGSFRWLKSVTSHGRALSARKRKSADKKHEGEKTSKGEEKEGESQKLERKGRANKEEEAQQRSLCGRAKYP